MNTSELRLREALPVDAAAVAACVEAAYAPWVERIGRKPWPVHPGRTGQGFGRALLVRAEQEARARGYSSVFLYTNEKMTENIAMYVRAGYLEYERREELGFRRVFLRKALR